MFVFLRCVVVVVVAATAAAVVKVAAYHGMMEALNYMLWKCGVMTVVIDMLRVLSVN